MSTTTIAQPNVKAMTRINVKNAEPPRHQANGRTTNGTTSQSSRLESTVVTANAKDIQKMNAEPRRGKNIMRTKEDKNTDNMKRLTSTMSTMSSHRRKSPDYVISSKMVASHYTSRKVIHR